MALRLDNVPEGFIGIYNEKDLRNIANDLTAKYIVMEDIKLTQDWVAIGTTSKDSTANVFIGELNGNYHIIAGLNINTDYSNQGLFAIVGQENNGIVNNGKISNLSIEGTVKAEDFVGIIAGHNYGTIENIRVKGTVDALRDVGGIVGFNRRSNRKMLC